MSTEATEALVPTSAQAISATTVAPSAHEVSKVVEILLGAPNENTRRGYEADIRAYADWAGVEPALAISHLIGLGPLEGHVQVSRYRDHLVSSGLKPGSVNRRLTTLRTLVKLAKTLGVSSWTVEIKGLRAETYRDTRGPGTEAVRELIASADADAKKGGREGLEGTRDAMLLRLMFTLGLRRGEVSSLDIGHVDLRQKQLWVLGKGRGTREALTISSAGLLRRLADWIHLRRSVGATSDSPLFVNMVRGSKGQAAGTVRLSGSSIWHTVVNRSQRVLGQRTRPHGLRHTAITETLEQNNGNVRATQKFSRHKRVDTVLIYDDSRRDDAGAAAKGLSNVLGDD